MELKQLTEIQKKAKEGKASLEDVILITSECFLSQTKRFKEMKQDYTEKLCEMEISLQEILSILQAMKSPIYQVEIEENED